MDPPDTNVAPSVPPGEPSEPLVEPLTTTVNMNGNNSDTPHGVQLPDYDESIPFVGGAALSTGPPVQSVGVNIPLVDPNVPPITQGESQTNGDGSIANVVHTYPATNTPHSAPPVPYPTYPTQSVHQQTGALPYPSGPDYGITSGATPYPLTTAAPTVGSPAPIPYPPTNETSPMTVSPLPPLPYPPTNGAPAPMVGDPAYPPTSASDQSAVSGHTVPSPNNETPLIANETQPSQTQEDGRTSRRSRRGIFKLPSYRGGRDYPSEPPPSYEESNPIPIPENIAPRQPSHTPQPAFVPPNSPIVVRTFGDSPTYTLCPSCREQVRTVLSYVPGVLTYLLFCLFLLIGWWFLCCLIPFCVPGWQDVEHICPNCKRMIGRYDRLG